jgi:hypothetical protein
MQVPHNYISHHQFSEQKQLFQAKPLFGNDDAIIELLDHMDEKPAFHLIRTPRGDKHAALISQFKTIFKDKLFEYWSEPTLAQTGIDFTQMINQPPDVHTFLFIIDKIRCAKTINIENINIVYDRFVKKPDSDSIIQGFAGRCTGYHKHSKHIKLFSFKEIILNHQCEHSLNDSKHKGNIFKPF